MSELRIRAHEIIDNISEKKIAQVLDFLEYLKIKEEVEATNEILSDKILLDYIQKGLFQIEQGELIELDEVKENV